MSLKIAQGATVCQDAELIGDITIGKGTVVHPKCTIRAEGGPIIIGERSQIYLHVASRQDSHAHLFAAGEGNVFEEQSLILNPAGGVAGPMTIGSNNLFEIGSQVRSRTIGDHNVIEPKSSLAEESTVGNGCVIGAKVAIDASTHVPDTTVVYRHAPAVPIASGVKDPSASIFAAPTAAEPPKATIKTRSQENAAEIHASLIENYRAILTDPESRCFLGNYHHLKQ
jgi:dynactin-6